MGSAHPPVVPPPPGEVFILPDAKPHQFFKYTKLGCARLRCPQRRVAILEVNGLHTVGVRTGKEERV